jgi:OTU domain-containing protein 5
MLEDKLKATDWEATDEAIEAQVARESYLQWLRDNEKRRESASTSTAQPQAQAHAKLPPSSGRSPACRSAGLASPKPGTSSSRFSPDAPRYPAGPCSSTSTSSSSSTSSSLSNSGSSSPGVAGGSGSAGGARGRKSPERKFELDETASFLNNLPPEMFGQYCGVYRQGCEPLIRT